ncbi:14044_t:CDS:1, partial [Gigaspora margarita]
KSDFLSNRDRNNHINRKNKCRPPNYPQLPVILPEPKPQMQTPADVNNQRNNILSIEDLANWLANLEIKNNPTIISKKVPKTDAEWFDLMEKTSYSPQKEDPSPEPEIIPDPEL